jgi:hypothetical protein
VDLVYVVAGHTPVQVGRHMHCASGPLPESAHEALILFYLVSDIFKSAASSKFSTSLI